jgi:hypothetical protein
MLPKKTAKKAYRNRIRFIVYTESDKLSIKKFSLFPKIFKIFLIISEFIGQLFTSIILGRRSFAKGLSTTVVLPLVVDHGKCCPIMFHH